MLARQLDWKTRGVKLPEHTAVRVSPPRAGLLPDISRNKLMRGQAQAHNAKAIFSSISAFEARYNVPFVWEASPQLAARLVERWSWFFWRERTAIGRKAGTCPIPSAIVKGHTAAATSIEHRSHDQSRCVLKTADNC